MKAKAKKDKKMIFLVTDGNDNTSAITIERLIEKVRESEILIYALAMLNEEDRGEAKKAKRALEALATASGGTVYYPKDLVDVEKLALDVAHEIRNQYVLAYSPVNAVLDGSFRQLRVTVDGPDRFAENARWADAIFATGSTVVNGTIDAILSANPDTCFYGVTIAGVAKLMGLHQFCYITGATRV